MLDRLIPFKYSHETDFIHWLLNENEKKLGLSFTVMFRYIDGVLCSLCLVIMLIAYIPLSLK